jgi:hypothetical protein
MDEFIAAIVSFPTIVFTVALFVVVGYWLLALIGGLGSDFLDGAAGKIDAVAGKVDGAVEAMAGKVDGAVDAMAGKVDGSVDAMAGKVDGAADGAAGKVDAVTASGGESLLTALGFGKAPATLVITMLTVFAWTLSTLGTLWAHEFGVAGPVVLGGIGLGAMLLAGIFSGLIARALGRTFKRHQPIKRGELVGKIATVSTGRVDERFGQAHLHEDGAELVIDVRCPTPNTLVRHVKVVIVSYDAENHLYTVEAFEQKDIQLRG